MSQRSSRWVRWLATPIALAAAAGVTAVLGGFRPAGAPEPPRVAPGRAIDQGLYHTQVLRAYVGRRHDLISDSRKSWLTVEFRVVNMSDDTLDPADFAADPFRQVLTVSFPTGRVDPLKHVERVERGAWMSEQVPPRTPVRLIVAWYDWAGTEPDRVTVSLPAFEHRAPVFFDMPVVWQTKLIPNKTADTRDDAPVIAARVTVPVTHEDVP